MLLRLIWEGFCEIVRLNSKNRWLASIDKFPTTLAARPGIVTTPVRKPVNLDYQVLLFLTGSYRLVI